MFFCFALLPIAGAVLTEHNMQIHGYFILAGRPDVPTLFRVHRARDGGSFTTRTVEVLQENRIIFTMMASFHRPEPGPEFQVSTQRNTTCAISANANQSKLHVVSS